MPKKSGSSVGGAEKEKLPSELEQMLRTKLNALQEKFETQAREAEEATARKQEAIKDLDQERVDRKDNVEYLQAELAKKQDEMNMLQEKFISLQEDKDTQARRLKAELEKAKDTIGQQSQRLEQLAIEVSTRGDQLLELGQLKTHAAADVTLKGRLSSELEQLRPSLLALAQPRLVSQSSCLKGPSRAPVCVLQAPRPTIMNGGLRLVHLPPVCMRAE